LIAAEKEICVYKDVLVLIQALPTEEELVQKIVNSAMALYANPRDATMAMFVAVQ
jgi:hypothetical protein